MNLVEYNKYSRRYLTASAYTLERAYQGGIFVMVFTAVVGLFTHPVWWLFLASVGYFIWLRQTWYKAMKSDDIKDE